MFAYSFIKDGEPFKTAMMPVKGAINGNKGYNHKNGKPIDIKFS